MMTLPKNTFRNARNAFALLAVLCLLSPAQAQLSAGAAKADITPDVMASKIPLGGYGARRGRPSTGVHDHVYSRAIVFAEGTEKVAVVSLDLCFLPANIRTEVFKHLQADGVNDIPLDHLFLSATHTHSAPDPLAMHGSNHFTHVGWTPFDQALLDFTTTRIAQSIADADKHLTAAQIGTGLVNADALHHNRRGEKLTDPDMIVLKVTDTQNHPIAAIVNFASHPTIYSDKNMEVSADWPGPMTADVEQTLGNDAVCLFLNGAEGDASPDKALGATDAEKVVNYGHAVAMVAESLLNSVKTDPNATLKAWITSVPLPARKPAGGFLMAAMSMGATMAEARKMVDVLMPDKTLLTFVQIGDLLLMGFPCEPISDIGLAAKADAKAAGYKTPAIVALTNDWLGYCLTPEKYNKGGYEPTMSFYGDQFGPILMSALKTSLEAHRQASAN